MARVKRQHQLLDLGLTALATALGAWCSQGVLDRVGTTDAVRVAMLPSVWALAAAGGAVFATTGAIYVALSWMAQPSARVALVDDMADWARPLRLSGLLVLPFLPWVAEALPLTHALAGPGRWYVWALCAAHIGYRALSTLTPRGGMVSLLLALGTVVVYGGSAARLGGTPLFPGGDEPHYLVMTQSLLTDGDLRIENNHDRGDYRAYFHTDLEPHYRARGSDGEIYSIHPVGLPVLTAPAFAAGGYWGVVASMVLCSSVVAWLLWRRTLQMTGSIGAASFAWAGTFLSPAFVFNSFTVYPEMAAALVTAAVFLTVTAKGAPAGRSRHTRWWLMGLATGLLPWLSTKYAPLSAALMVVCGWRALHPDTALESRSFTRPASAQAVSSTPADGVSPERFAGADAARRLAALGIPYALSLMAWLASFYVIWGSPWPSAPYGADDQTSPGVLWRGVPGLLFDQEYGVVATAPVLIVALSGLWHMVRDGGGARRLAFEIGLVVAALWFTVGAFELWWGGTANTGRPVMAALGLLAIPMGRAQLQVANRPAARALHTVLLVVGLANVAVLLGAQEGLLLVADGEGASRLLEWLSPSRPLGNLVPSFMAQPWGTAMSISAVWLLAAAIAAALTRAFNGPRAGTVATATTAAAVFLALVASGVIQRSLVDRPERPLQSRTRVPLLDRFDAGRLPLTLRYDPLSPIDPSDLVGSVALTATPEERRPRTPVPLLFNARFSLPAGHYLVELIAGREAPTVTNERLALQLGRAGPASQEWDVSLSAPGVWGRTFELPVDMGFVGFRGTERLTSAGLSLRVRPISVVDEHRRVPVGQVLSVKRYGPVVAVFEHEDAWPEASGFWVSGGQLVQFRVNPDTRAIGDPPTELVLRIHSGEIPNTVVLGSRGKAERLELFPKRIRTVVLPLGTDGATTITVSARDFFIPAERDSNSRDRRHLGCWVEIVGFEEPVADAGAARRGLS